MNKKIAILVTGAAGHIGSNLCQWILSNHPEYEVLAVDDLSGGYLEFIPTGCEIYIRNAGDDLTDIFKDHDIKIVFHAAAIAAESAAMFKRKHYYQNNVVASANIINYCIEYNVDRLVYFSSMAVYGRNDPPFIESQLPNPCDPYGNGKRTIEIDLDCARETHGLKYTIVRPHSVYGNCQNIWDQSRNVLGIFMRKTMNNEPLTIYGDGQQQRAFTFIADILEPLWLCGTEESTLWQTFNIGNDEEMTILEAANICKEVCGNPHDFKFLPGIHEVRNAFSDHKKAREILGLECKTSLKDGMIKMWEWAKVQPKRELQKLEGFEIKSGLYDMWK